MSPQLKEFITVVLLDLAENCDWTISPTGQIEHSPFFEYAEKHAHIIETELDDMRTIFVSYILSEEAWRESKKDPIPMLIEANFMREKAKEVLGL